MFLATIETHYTTQHQIQFYAKELACSPTSLDLACQINAQKSAKQLIFERLLLENKRILVHSNLTVHEIGEQIGFHDSTHFGKFFKQYQGITAQQFRHLYGIYDK